MLNFDHKPTYTWPNPAFPFREYFSDPNLRIFILENIHHNWNWLKDHSRRFQSRDHFLVYCGWYFDDWFLSQDCSVFDALNLDKSKFYFLFNSEEEMLRYKSAGFQGDLINQNCWLDWNGVMQPNLEIGKEYDAIYVARFTPFKRHELTIEVPNLALVMGNLHGGSEASELPNHIFRNEEQLSEEGVAIKINQSRCGLILSEIEGACFASSEYLLCGVPVVSTHSKGGRDFWYNNYNSIIVGPNASEVRAAVEYFVHNPRDPIVIRNAHIESSNLCREKFISWLSKIFYENCVNQDAKVFFESSYMHKLRKSEEPDFKSIWPG